MKRLELLITPPAANRLIDVCLPERGFANEFEPLHCACAPIPRHNRIGIRGEPFAAPASFCVAADRLLHTGSACSSLGECKGVGNRQVERSDSVWHCDG